MALQGGRNAGVKKSPLPYPRAPREIGVKDFYSIHKNPALGERIGGCHLKPGPETKAAQP